MLYGDSLSGERASWAPGVLSPISAQVMGAQGTCSKGMHSLHELFMNPCARAPVCCFSDSNVGEVCPGGQESHGSLSLMSDFCRQLCANHATCQRPKHKSQTKVLWGPARCLMDSCHQAVPS